MKNELKIENIFKHLERLARTLAQRRLLLYKTTGLLLIILAISTLAYFAWQAWQGTQSVEAADNPIAWYRFEEQSGTTAYDSSGNGYDGTLGGDGAGTDIPVWVQGGKTGGALRFDGSDDYISLGTSAGLDHGSGDFALAAWIKTADATTSGRIVADDNNGVVSNGIVLNAGKAQFFMRDAESDTIDPIGTSVVANSQWHYVTGVRSGNTGYIYVDGVQENSETTANVGSVDSTGATYISGRNAGDLFFNGFIDDIRIYDYALTASQVTERYIGTKPIAYWNFDEGYASTTYDRIGSNDGTLQSNTQWVEGKFGKALSFDGTDDSVSMGNVMDITTGSFSVSAFVKQTHFNDTSYRAIVMKRSGQSVYSGYRLTINRTAQTIWNPNFFVSDSITTGSHEAASALSSVNIYNSNNFYHLVGVWDASTKTAYIYVDGQLTGSAQDTDIVTLSNAASLTIGNSSLSTVRYFPGIIDEVKIYPRALEANEIAALYNSTGESTASFQTGSGDNYNASLVGYWKFDETSAWGATAGAVKDSSGLNNHGTSTNATTTTDKAKFGRSAGFDGSGDYVDTGQASRFQNLGNKWTVSMWFRARSDAYSRIISNEAPRSSGQYGLALHTRVSDTLWVSMGAPGSSVQATASGMNYVGRWVHLTGKQEGDTLYIYVDGVLQGTQTGVNAINTTNPLLMGRSADLSEGSTEFNGYIDDVKIFNKALTDEQVMREYVSGPAPVGWWKFEEQSGQSVNDSSGVNPTGSFGADTSVAADDPSWSAGGKVGGAVRFDGTDDYILMSDATAALRLPYSFTAQQWVYFNGLPGANTYTAIISKGSDTLETAGNNDNYNITVDNGLTGTGYNFVGSYETSAGTDVTANWTNSGITTKRWYHAAVTRDGGTGILTFYVDGILRASTTSATIPDTGTNPVELGDDLDNLGGVGVYFNGLLDDVKVYNYARTPRQLMEDINGGAPVGYWKFDEGYASTTYDGSGQGNNGTLMDNTLWTMNGKFGKALDFDGTNDYVSLSANLLSSADAATWSAWVKPESTSGTRYIYYRGGVSSADQVYLQATTNKFVCDLDSITGRQSKIGNDVLSLNSWYHVVCTYDSAAAQANRVRIYINGIEDTVVASTNTGSGIVGSNNESISTNASSAAFDGLIDEVKIYNYARTAAEIRNDYVLGTSVSGGSQAATFGSKRDANSTWDDGGFGGDAPVGYWRFEEQGGTTANDASGNLNTGSFSGAPVWVAGGKVGGALKFDGSDDFVNAGNGASLSFGTGNFAIATWIKTTVDITAGQYDGIVAKYVDASTVGLWIQIDGNQYILFGWTGTVPLQGDRAVNDGIWHHIVGQRTGLATAELYLDGVLHKSTAAAPTGTSDSAGNFDIGRINVAGRYFNGSIDEVKIYNYARSAAQVAFDYNGGKPVAQWKFDEGSGVTTRDSSGNSNTGTMYPGSGGSVTATSSMWVTGKVGKAVSFDGTDDYVYESGSSLFNFSEGAVCYWIKPASLSAGGHHVVNSADQGSTTRYLGFAVFPTVISIAQRNADTTDVVTAALSMQTGTWYHICNISNGSAYSIYVNGVAQTLTVAGGTNSGDWFADTTARDNLVIGAIRRTTVSDFYNGQIDDVRIYSYSRSAEQVKQDYNNGAGVRF